MITSSTPYNLANCPFNSAHDSMHISDAPCMISANRDINTVKLHSTYSYFLGTLFIHRPTSTVLANRPIQSEWCLAEYQSFLGM